MAKGIARDVPDSVLDTLDRQVRLAEQNLKDARAELARVESASPKPAGSLGPEEVAKLLVLTDELYKRGELQALRECLLVLIEGIDVRLWRKQGEHPRVKRGEVIIDWRPLSFLKDLFPSPDNTESLRRTIIIVCEDGYRHVA